jgi:hypothetical protein
MITNPLIPTADENAEKHKNLPTESYCQTPKEKECWHLYRRMCDKGVFVSFDTVLRYVLKFLYNKKICNRGINIIKFLRNNKIK